MAKMTLIFAGLLILLGVVGYVGNPTGDSSASQAGSEVNSAPSDAGRESAEPKRSVTALIPAFVGILLLLCGGLALNEQRRMQAMHAAVVVGLLGFLAAAGRGSMGLFKLMSIDSDVNRRSLIFVWLMAILCGIYVAMCVNSFIQARRRQREE